MRPRRCDALRVRLPCLPRLPLLYASDASRHGEPDTAHPRSAVKPYRADIINSLAIGCNFVLLLLFFGATCLEFSQGVRRNAGVGAGGAANGDQIAEAVLGWGSDEEIVGVMLIFTFGVLPLLLGLMVYRLMVTEPISVFRLVKTRQRPLLVLESGMKWHLYLSHM